jgi:hypothetical protein
VRAIDIRDPLNPKEIGHYIPAVTDKTQNRCVGQGTSLACNRGYIYIADRANTGMHILQLRGAARQVANGLPPLRN